ncbi:MAG: hypothetical protein ACJ8B6_07565 [Gemmatimonadales bacterium]
MNGAVLVVLVGLGGLVLWVFKLAARYERSNEAQRERREEHARRVRNARPGAPPK